MTRTPSPLTGRLVRPDGSSGDASSIDVLADLLDTLRLATAMYGRFELAAPWGIQLPDDRAVHIVVVGHGGAHLQPDGIGRPVELSAGDMALLPYGGAHALRSAAGTVLQALGPAECQRVRTAQPIRLGGDGARTTLVAGAFRLRTAHRLLSLPTLPTCIHVTADEPTGARWLMSSLQMLIAEGACVGPGAAIVLNRLADLLFVQAIRTFMATSDCGEHELRALTDPQIAMALALIHGQPEASWTVESLAAAVTLSRSGFATRFRALVGAAPLECLTRWRMVTAAKLLRESDLAMIEVARRVGYQSEAAFSRAFKRCEGVTHR